MDKLGSYKNVFDDKQEFEKLHDLIIGAVQEFSVYRDGSLTYGEIMYVMECILDNMRGTSEKDAADVIPNIQSPTFTALMAITARLVETMMKKGYFGSAEEVFILHGER
ncbi:MAG: hypothetical protein LBU70_00580 [Chitinispirillales bacterium]|jgi:hypothetical protein|nr:hypothetical protein [Chitinispirillales bacterium]